VAALQCGMKFVGCEIDPETFQQAKGRLAQEQKAKRKSI
jgi:DNA modification methylase